MLYIYKIIGSLNFNPSDSKTFLAYSIYCENDTSELVFDSMMLMDTIFYMALFTAVGVSL